MNRQEAISNLKGIKDFYGDDRDDGYVQEFVAMDKDEKEAIDMAIEALQDDWIPVSEGLPKKDGRYQVTRYDYVTNTEFIDILWYEENIWWNRHSTGDYAVIAWKPLPEPYKGGDTEWA